MKHNTISEQPFEYLRRNETNEFFAKKTVENWYVARAFVLSKLVDISFAPGANQHLHVVISGDSPMMLAVLRQVALSAHYPNFVEYDQYNRLVCKNRTVITLVSDKDANFILKELRKEEVLCNLLDYCKYSLYGVVHNEDSFLDIEIEMVRDPINDKDSICICEEDIDAFVAGKTTEERDTLLSVDTHKAIYASRAYSLGAVIDNLPYEDIFCSGRYNQALGTFQYLVLQDNSEMQLISSKWKSNLITVKNGLSNVICADCFESRELAIKRLCSDYNKLDEQQRTAIWEKNNLALSLSEHSRWNVEKLILGFRPLNEQEIKEYESLFGDRRTAYLKQLKNNSVSPAHIDLCSYRDLRRVDPDNLKYDSFLMLAIPLILDKIRKEDSNA